MYPGISKAFHCWAFILFTTSIFHASGQSPTPIFKDKRDSLEFANLQVATAQAMKLQNSDPKLFMSTFDSLMRLQVKLRDKAIGFKIIYKADKNFTNYREVADGTVKPENVTRLTVSDYNAAVLPPQVFLCANMTELELVNTGIKKLSSKLRKLSKLTKVYIYNNTSSSRLKLGRNTSVREIVIRGLKAENLPSSYKRFSSLETIDLSRNIGMMSFPNIYKNKKLIKLNVLENNLTLTDLRSMRGGSLEEINLMKNKIKMVPDAIGSFRNLKKLTLNYNEIAQVSQEIGALKNLESLSFYRNQLTAIPSGVFELQNLQSIDLYFNRLDKVSPDISELSNLRILYLSNNLLTSLPESLGDLKDLTELYVHDNKLENLPSNLENLKKLKVLRVNNNYLTSIPPSVLALKELENLDVSKNYMYQFPVQLSDFTKLQILAIANNPWENKVEMEQTLEVLRARGTVTTGQ